MCIYYMYSVYVCVCSVCMALVRFIWCVWFNVQTCSNGERVCIRIQGVCVCVCAGHEVPVYTTDHLFLSQTI